MPFPTVWEVIAGWSAHYVQNTLLRTCETIRHFHSTRLQKINAGAALIFKDVTSLNLIDGQGSS